MSEVITGNWTRGELPTYTAPSVLIIGLAIGVIGAFSLILLAVAIAGRMICIARKYDARNKELVLQLANRGISADEALNEAKRREESARQVRVRGSGAALLLQTAGGSDLPVARPVARPSQVRSQQPPRAVLSLANLPRAIVQAVDDDVSSDEEHGAEASLPAAASAASESSPAAVRGDSAAASAAKEERRAD
jgi:hypothetical protein